MISNNERENAVEHVKLSELNDDSFDRLVISRRDLIANKTLIQITGCLESSSISENCVIVYSLEPNGECYRALIDLSLMLDEFNLNDININNDIVQFVGFKLADASNDNATMDASQHKRMQSFKAVYHRILKRTSLKTFYRAIDMQRESILKLRALF